MNKTLPCSGIRTGGRSCEVKKSVLSSRKRPWLPPARGPVTYSKGNDSNVSWISCSIPAKSANKYITCCPRKPCNIIVSLSRLVGTRSIDKVRLAIRRTRWECRGFNPSPDNYTYEGSLLFVSSIRSKGYIDTTTDDIRRFYYLIKSKYIPVASVVMLEI